MTHSKEQISILLNHATYLESGKLKAGFDMEYFRNEAECGTVCCSIGHLPYSTGIELDFEEDWDEYSLRVIGIERCGELSEAWQYLFNTMWSMFDNTPEAAAARIRYYVAHGVPEGWTYSKEFAKPTLK